MNEYRSGRGRNVGSMTPEKKSVSVMRLVIFGGLIALLIASLCVGLPTRQAKQTAHDYVVTRLATECRSAFDASQSLSLTGGADSYDTLSKIRSYVYAMQAMVNTDTQLDGHVLVAESDFAAVYRIVEQFQGALNKGNMTTASYVTDLQNTLSALYQQVLALN